MKHKYADLIHAWADGAEIQRKTDRGEWVDLINTDEFRTKPDPPREPVRAWADQYVDQNLHLRYVFYDTEEKALNCAVPERKSPVPLIEAGYCQMLEHNGSDVCPVTLSSRVTIRECDGTYFTCLAGEMAAWHKVTHYAVILPVLPE